MRWIRRRIDEIRFQLLEYLRIDTFGMVRIVEEWLGEGEGYVEVG